MLWCILQHFWMSSLGEGGSNMHKCLITKYWSIFIFWNLLYDLKKIRQGSLLYLHINLKWVQLENNSSLGVAVLTNTFPSSQFLWSTWIYIYLLVWGKAIQFRQFQKQPLLQFLKLDQEKSFKFKMNSSNSFECMYEDT